MSLRRLLVLSTLWGLSCQALAAEPREPGQLVLPDLSSLAKKAAQSVVVSLDPTLIGLAGGLLSADPNPNDAAVKDVIRGLRGVYVRSYSFDQDGAYSRTDVDAVLAQLSPPAWLPLVSTHDRTQHEDLDIYIRRSGERTQGMAIIAERPRQLTIVNIVGAIDLAKLSQLQGQFGIPRLGMRGDSADAASSAPSHASDPHR